MTHLACFLSLTKVQLDVVEPCMLNTLILHKNSMWLLLIVLYVTVFAFRYCGSSAESVVANSAPFPFSPRFEKR